MFHAGAPVGWHLVAFAVREKLVYNVLQFAHDALVGIWAEILSPQLMVSGEDESGVLFVGDAEIRIGLIVFEHTVVSRLVAFYEVVLQQQGINFGGHNSNTYVVYVPYQHLYLTALVLVVREIGAYPPLQVTGFAYINHCPRLVKMLIYPGVFRDCLEAQFNAFYIFVYRSVYHEWEGYTTEPLDMY